MREAGILVQEIPETLNLERSINIQKRQEMMFKKSFPRALPDSRKIKSKLQQSHLAKVIESQRSDKVRSTIDIVDPGSISW